MKSPALILLLFLTSPTFAQQYAATLGVHETSANSRAANGNTGSVEGKFNFRGGLLAHFDLVDRFKFRTGVGFTQRHVALTYNGNSYLYNFDYIDVPVNILYSITPVVGVFGGMVVAANFKDEISTSAVELAKETEKMIPILNLGVNFLFNDEIGFDLYYERGLGKSTATLSDPSAFGMNVMYWF